MLGRGGFGVVLKAYDPALSRIVAIKVLASQLAASAAARSRFAREARAAAAVVHENVVAIHAVDSWNGLPYLVMPCIAGRSLQERVDRDGPLAVKEVLRIGMQTALGLAAAHDQGLVHRDVKPSNILLENGVERVKLSDFGLARAVDDASLTQSGVVAGTPQYMSPEQARGEAVDHRSDLFSLGSVLYFMCAGHPPFRADSTPAVLRRVCDDRPRPLREVNPDVPDWLAEIVDRLHAKEPAGRFAIGERGRRGPETPPGRSATHAGLRPRSARSLPTPVRKRPGRKTAVAVLLTTAVVLRHGHVRGARPHPRLLAAFRRARHRRPRTPAGAGSGGALAARSPGTNPRMPRSSARAIRPQRTWRLADFDSLEIMHPFRVEVIRADRFGVTVTADDNVLEHVKAIKEGSALKIALEEGKSYRMKAGSLKATVRMPALARLGLSHGARGTVRGFKSDRNLKVRVSHGSTLEGEIEAGDVAFEASHGSTLDLKGKATRRHGSSCPTAAS